MTIEEFFGSLWSWASGLASQVSTSYILPNVRLLAQALILLFIAYVAGRISKAMVVKILDVTGLKKTNIRSWTDDLLRAIGYRGDIVHFIGDLVKWFVYIIFFGIIIETIGLPGLVNIFTQIAGFVPKFIISILIVVVGFLMADFIGKIFEEAGRRIVQDEMASAILGGVTKYSIALASIIMALSLVGLDTTSLLIMLAIVLGAAVTILVIGLRGMVPDFVAGLHLKKCLRPGQDIKVCGYSGKMEKVEPLSTIIRTGSGNVSIPNSEVIRNPVEWKRPEKK